MIYCIIIGVVLSYLLGTLTFGIISAKIFNLGDLKKIGSGNTGATNVLRTGNKKAAAFTLIGDALKGVIAVSLWRIFPETTIDHGIIFGFCAFVGHVFPVWQKFKGGKGVATYLGVLFGIDIVIGLFGCILWLIGGSLSRISAIGALNMAILMPVMLLFSQNNMLLPIILAIMTLILALRHKDNILRLISGEENKF